MKGHDIQFSAKYIKNKYNFKKPSVVLDTIHVCSNNGANDGFYNYLNMIQV